VEFNKPIVKYNKGTKTIFLVVCIFSLIGYIIDFIIFSPKYNIIQDAYHILSFILCLYALIMNQLTKGKYLKAYYNLIAYTAVLNIFCSHIFFHKFLDTYAGASHAILSRDAFFLLCYISLAGFISSRKHIIIQGILLVLLIFFYTFILKSPFFIENGPVYTLVVIGFCYIMYFFTGVVKDSLHSLNLSNQELKKSNQDLDAQHKELETTLNELQNAQEQLIRSEKMASLGILAAGVAHEINNPLNFIQGGITYIEYYLNNNLKEHELELKPIVEGIKKGVERSADIVISLNHFSRQNESYNDKCNLHLIIESCLVILHNEMKNKVEVIKEFTTDPFIAIGNEGKLHQVFLNILSNASQAIEKNGKIVIRTAIVDNQLVITVFDTGKGISSEHMPKIFDPFFTTKEAGKGTGLGLSIVYTIINEHRGSIEFKSQKDLWTEVMVKLPCKL
jgi:signal transduction histidine kinase